MKSCVVPRRLSRKSIKLGTIAKLLERRIFYAALLCGDKCRRDVALFVSTRIISLSELVILFRALTSTVRELLPCNLTNAAGLGSVSQFNCRFDELTDLFELNKAFL